MQHNGQFVFYRPKDEAKKDEAEEKEGVSNMGKQNFGGLQDALTGMHKNIGGFRYHRLLDVLAASYNREGLPLDSVSEIINMNIDIVKGMVTAQPPLYRLLEIYSVEEAGSGLGQEAASGSLYRVSGCRS